MSIHTVDGEDVHKDGQGRITPKSALEDEKADLERQLAEVQTKLDEFK